MKWARLVNFFATEPLDLAAQRARRGKAAAITRSFRTLQQLSSREALSMSLEEDWIFVPLVETLRLGEPQVYACAGCKAHLTAEGNVLSKDFTTRNGRGMLVTSVINVTNGAETENMLRTGLHTIEDVSCVSCGAVVGWKYKDAHEPAQRYKIGKFVVDMVKLVKCDWESDEGN